VGYRVWCARIARGAGVAGWVHNLEDGSVELELEGLPEAVGEVEKRCRKGPPMASVTSVDASDEEPTGDYGFKVR
jgi:acylphosphatase